jgi:uroporphyrinogen III methyltransferase/synthase
MITRARSQASVFAEAVEKLGGEAIVFPTIEILPPESYQPLDDAIRRIRGYDWIIFTSVNGVKSFLARLGHLGQDHRAIERIRIAAIGPETARAVESALLRVDLLPKEYRAEAILEELDPGEVVGKRILIPRAARARNVLPETLQKWGAVVDLVPAYRTAAARGNIRWLRGLLQEKKVDVITFTSSSTATHFAALFEGERLGELLGRTVVACIGPVTRDTVEALGIRVEVVPQDYTISGLTRAIVEYFEGQRQ